MPKESNLTLRFMAAWFVPQTVPKGPIDQIADEAHQPNSRTAWKRGQNWPGKANWG